MAEWLKPETVIKVGSCMKEVLAFHKEDIEQSDILKRLKLKKNDFFVLSTHREENIDSEENFTDLLETLNAISKKYKKRIIFSTHPRTMKKIKKLADGTLNPLIEVMKPLGFFDYINLQMNAFCAISDSGTITEESSLLGFPAITIRNAHERPEGMDSGVLIMSGLKAKRVIESIDLITKQYAGNKERSIVPDYEVDRVSPKVVRIIQSYTDYVNRTVWRL